jgi:hypothetical protein
MAAKALAALDVSPDEDRARRALGWGVGILLLGLGLVGVGEATAGTVPVLAGLLATIGAIHIYGRLGPAEAEAAARSEGRSEGTPAPRTARKRKGKVEKRRRMDESPPP